MLSELFSFGKFSFSFYTGFAWQGFSSREAIGVATVRRCWKLPLCLIEPVPAGSKMDPPWEVLTLEKFMEDCLLWDGPHAGAAEECEEEVAAETICDELTVTPIPCPRHVLLPGERRQRNWEWSWAWEEGVVKIWFYFSLSYSNFSELSLLCPWW